MSSVYIGKNDALKQLAKGFFQPKRRGKPGFFNPPTMPGFHAFFHKTGDFIALDIAINNFVIGAHN